MKKQWQIVAHETIVHSWTVEADTEEEAHEIAGDGCPMPDCDCVSQEFEITKVAIETHMKIKHGLCPSCGHHGSDCIGEETKP